MDRRPPHRLRIRGVVHERQFFGPKLELVTELSTCPGRTTFRIEDAVTNRGGMPQEFQLIYHVNYGVLRCWRRCAKVVAAREQLGPEDAHAAERIDNYATYAGPTPRFIEQVYLARPRADGSGAAPV